MEVQGRQGALGAVEQAPKVSEVSNTRGETSWIVECGGSCGWEGGGRALCVGCKGVY
jgi:hypothetical protein